jgi:putative transposase
VTDSNVFQLSQPGTLSDPLTEVLRSGARALLAQAVAAEVAGFLEGHADKRTEDGRQRLVRHGHLPERAIMTGIGPVAVRAPRIRDRVGTGEERIAFSSAILPPYARRSKSLEVLIPILYLKGISTGGFEEALAALLGKDAGGLSARPSHGSGTFGRTSTRAGRSGICRSSATSISGQMASTCKPGSRTMRNACW